MAIRDAAQQARDRAIDAAMTKEAETRPEPLHRAVRFLLQEAIQNNRDCRPAAEHHLRILDKEYGDTEKLAELEPSPKPVAVPAAETAPAAENENQPRPPVRPSRRFQRQQEA
jgi:hypothetical protein